MPLAPPVTDIEQLKDRPFVADLLAWRASAVESARFDRNELTIYIAREAIREACARLKAQGLTDFMSDLTCAASCCRKTGKAILCAGTIRWRAIVNGPLELQSGAGRN